MLSLELVGKVKELQELQSFDSGFTKRSLILEVEENGYKNDLNIEFLKDKTSLLDSLMDGDSVKVNVNIRGSEYQGKYYVSLNGWKVSSNE